MRRWTSGEVDMSALAFRFLLLAAGRALPLICCSRHRSRSQWNAEDAMVFSILMVVVEDIVLFRDIEDRYVFSEAPVGVDVIISAMTDQFASEVSDRLVLACR